MDEDWSISEERGGPASHVLVFDEIVASDREDLVAEAVEFLPSVRGVTAVEHVERNIVEITAPGVPGGHLTRRLRRWWDEAAGQQRSWMAAMDQAARTAAGLAPGFERDGWRLTRVVDAELTHTIVLDHRFGREPDEHVLSVTAAVRLALPERDMHQPVAHHSLDLADRSAFAEVVSGQIRPSLDALPSVDAMLERWGQDRSVEAGGRRPYPAFEALTHGRMLVARGRLPEAHVIYQHHYERTQPRQRAYVLGLVEQLGVPPLTTGVNPHLSAGDETALRDWHAGAAGRAGMLQRLTGVPLDGSRRSLDEVWGRMRLSADRFRTAFGDDKPVLPNSYYGVNASRVTVEPWFRVTVEVLTAYLGMVLTEKEPGTRWALAGDGELGMVLRGGTGLLSRVLGIAELPFEAADDEFDPRRLRRLADDMLRWLGDGRYDPQMELPG
ncbi:hypothetical protein AB0M02_36445 [Actinoplanes sp. NPDC051861]|uniref:hypothetical protein n=1 Tax=Actinoplanes sp. NPDC051861 TaxID=3155170 RepID=UPI003412B376